MIAIARFEVRLQRIGGGGERGAEEGEEIEGYTLRYSCEDLHLPNFGYITCLQAMCGYSGKHMVGSRE